MSRRRDAVHGDTDGQMPELRRWSWYRPRRGVDLICGTPVNARLCESRYGGFLFCYCLFFIHLRRTFPIQQLV